MQQHHCHPNGEKPSNEHGAHDHCAMPAGPIKLGKKLKIIGLAFIAIFLLSCLPILSDFNTSLVSYM